MLDILSYDFMQRAFIAGIILGLAIPALGLVVVLKRLSMIGDALSHTSLAGVAAGLIAGISPVLGASLACVAAAFTIEGIRHKFKGHAELAISIIMSCGIGLAGILLSFVPNAGNFNSFLFGSIVTISDSELIGICMIGAVVLFLSFVLYRQFFLVALDERSARLAGVKVATTNFIFVLMCALVVSVAARTVGALIVSSMMVVPVACALQVARSYKQTVLISCSIGLMSTLLGLIFSYYFDLKPGGTIVLVAIGFLLLILGFKALVRLNKKVARK